MILPAAVRYLGRAVAAGRPRAASTPVRAGRRARPTGWSTRSTTSSTRSTRRTRRARSSDEAQAFVDDVIPAQNALREVADELETRRRRRPVAAAEVPRAALPVLSVGSSAPVLEPGGRAGLVGCAAPRAAAPPAAHRARRRPSAPAVDRRVMRTRRRKRAEHLGIGARRPDSAPGAPSPACCPRMPHSLTSPRLRERAGKRGLLKRGGHAGGADPSRDGATRRGNARAERDRRRVWHRLDRGATRAAVAPGRRGPGGRHLAARLQPLERGLEAGADARDAERVRLGGRTCSWRPLSRRRRAPSLPQDIEHLRGRTWWSRRRSAGGWTAIPRRRSTTAVVALDRRAAEPRRPPRGGRRRDLGPAARRRRGDARTDREGRSRCASGWATPGESRDCSSSAARTGTAPSSASCDRCSRRATRHRRAEWLEARGRPGDGAARRRDAVSRGPNVRRQPACSRRASGRTGPCNTRSRGAALAVRAAQVPTAPHARAAVGPARADPRPVGALPAGLPRDHRRVRRHAGDDRRPRRRSAASRAGSLQVTLRRADPAVQPAIAARAPAGC